MSAYFAGVLVAALIFVGGVTIMVMGGFSAPARSWWLRTGRAFRAWMKANEQAHRNAPTLPCCSAPPPGAGRRPRPGSK